MPRTAATHSAMAQRSPWQVATQLLEVEWMQVLQCLRQTLLPPRPTPTGEESAVRTPASDWFEEFGLEAEIAAWIVAEPGGVPVSFSLIEAEIHAGDYFRDRGTMEGDDLIFHTATYMDVAFDDVRKAVPFIRALAPSCDSVDPPLFFYHAHRSPPLTFASSLLSPRPLRPGATS